MKELFLSERITLKRELFSFLLFGRVLQQQVRNSRQHEEWGIPK